MNIKHNYFNAVCCVVILLITALLQFYNPVAPYLDGGIILTVLVSFFVNGNTSTFFWALLGMLTITITGFLPHENLTVAEIIMQHVFSCIVTFICALGVLYVKKMGRSIEARQNQVQALFENAAAGVILSNKKGEIILTNASASKLFGYAPNELKGHLIEDLIPKRFQAAHAMHKEQFHQNPSTRFVLDRQELFAVKKDGTEFPVELGLSYYTENSELYVITFVLDVTGRKKAELELVKSELKFRSLVQNIADVIVLTNSKGHITYTSPSILDVLGYDELELTGRHVLELVHPSDYETAENVFVKICEMGGVHVTAAFRVKHKAGQFIYLEAGGSNQLNNTAVNAIVLTGRDITARVMKHQQEIALLDELSRKNEEHKQYEAALLQSETRYKFMFENSPAPMIIWDFETLNVIDCNEAAVAKYGYSRQEFIKLNIRDLRPPEDIGLINEATRNTDCYGKTHKKIWRHKKKNGDIIFVEVNAQLVELNGRTVSINHNNDITEQLEARHNLELSEERYKLLFYKSPLPKIIYNLDTNEILDINQIAVNEYGYSANAFKKMLITDIIPGPEQNEFTSFQKSVSNNNSLHILRSATHLHKNGMAIKVDVHGYRFNYLDIDCMLLICINITERINYITSIEQQNKKLKEIAWMQSHIIRLPLSRMMGLINLIQEDEIKEKEKCALMEHVLTSAHELDHIIHDISTKAYEAKIYN